MHISAYTIGQNFKPAAKKHPKSTTKNNARFIRLLALPI